MKHPIIKSSLLTGAVLGIVIFLNPSIHSQPETKSTVCDLQGMRTFFSTRVNELAKTKQSLVDMLQGRRIEKAVINTLFSIDVTKNDLVAARIRDLRETEPKKFGELYPGCSQYEMILSEQFMAVQSMESEVNRLKIRFLSLPLSQRTTLLKLAQITDEKAIAEDELKKEQADALQQYRTAVEASEKTDRFLGTGGDDETVDETTNRSVVGELTGLYTQLAGIANRTLELSQHYEALLVEYKTHRDTIASFSKKLSESKKVLSLAADYHAILTFWRGLVDKGISPERSSAFTVDESLMLMPGQGRITGNVDGKLFEEYSKTYRLLKERIDEMRAKLSKRRQNLIEIHYRTLTSASALRSAYVQRLAGLDMLRVEPTDVDFWADLLRELKVVPYRFVSLGLTRWVEFDHMLHEGWSGVFKVIKTVLIFVVFLLIPFAVFYLIKKFAALTDEIRKKIIFEKHPSRIKVKLSLWLKSLSPYLPYLVVYASISFIDYLLAGSLVQELALLTPYVRMFIIYRVFILIFESTLQRILMRSRLKNIVQYEMRIQKTARTIGLYFLLVYAVLYTAESTVGRALMYIILEYVFAVTGALAFLSTFFSWRVEIAGSVRSHFKSSFVHRVADAGTRIRGFILLVPLVLMLSVRLTVMWISRHVFELDLAKKASARIIRRQMEAAGATVQETDIETLPSQYKDLFTFSVPDDPDLFIRPETGDYDRCSRILKEWVEGDIDETSLAIYGEKGIGKSTMIELLKGIEGDYVRTIVSVPPKISTREDALGFFQNVLSFDFRGNILSIREWDKAAPRTVLYLDDAHNFFLASIGGFQGFKDFLDLINSGTRNLFVCATFNIHSWMYLDSIFGKNRYFRNVIGLSPWSENDIRSLIMKRHGKSDFLLTYDPVISAGSMYSERDNLENADRKFFRLLWEQSDGNPRTAIYSWLTCIEPRGGALHVGLPRDPEGEIFKDLQADALFVYAAVVKHENLTSAEAEKVTSMPRGLVSYSLKIAIERGFMVRDPNGRYRINPGWHGTVIQYLKERNLLYVN